MAFSLRLQLAVIAALAAPCVALRMAPLAPRAAVRARVVAETPRFSDPILDPKVTDPVYDQDGGYLGKSKFGFNQFAETINGRVAMSGFTICFLQELVTGRGGHRMS